MAFDDLATNFVMEQAELGRSRYDAVATLRLGYTADFRHSRYRLQSRRYRHMGEKLGHV